MEVVGSYLGHHQFLARLRDDERKKRELFKNDIYLNVVPLTLNVYEEIVYTLKMQDDKQFYCKNAYEYMKIIDNMLENNQIAIIAELVDNRICISISYEGKIYHSKELNSCNLRWLKANFSVVK